MKGSTLLAIGALAALSITIALSVTSGVLLIAITGVACVVFAAAVLAPPTGASHENRLGVGTVRTVRDVEQSIAGAVERLFTIEVETAAGDTFIGRLCCRPGDPIVSMLNPGLPVLVTFDPTARERLSLPDDVVAVRAAFDSEITAPRRR
jgi:hypothetical protein